MTLGLKSIATVPRKLPEFYTETVKVKLCSQQLFTRSKLRFLLISTLQLKLLIEGRK